MSRKGELFLKKPLDRETKVFYNIKAFVEDKGVPPQKSEIRVAIVVDDVNDEKPTFEKSSYVFQLQEELSAGTYIGQVIAIDKDTGTNGEFSYSLKNHQDKFKIETKEVSSNTICMLSSARRFDSERDKERYDVTVVATDHGNPQNTNEVVVQVYIVNINDHPPLFSDNLPYLGCVVHGTEKNVPVTRVEAMDNDLVPLPIRYHFIALTKADKPTLSLFWIDPLNGTVYTKKKITSSMKPIYEITIAATEESGDDKDVSVNYQKLIIFIAPRLPRVVFLDQCVQVSVRESELHDKGAISKPFRYNSAFKIGNYRIKRNKKEALPFKILRTTGLVQLRSHLNRKLKSYYQLNVTAEGDDNGKIYKDSIQFNVYVVPTNVYPPSYPHNPEEYTVWENWPKNQIFNTLKKATDKDAGMEGQYMYSLSETTPGNAPVKISALTGDMQFTTPLDHEKVSQYILKVRVTDLALDILQRQYNTLTIYIFISDINDNNPVFKSSNYSYVMEDEQPGNVVTTIQAEDPDTGKTKTNIIYSISSGNEDGTFSLGSTNGELITRKMLNIYKTKKYHLTIVASEKRNPTDRTPSLNSTMVLIVDVIDVNDKKPKFTKHNYQAHLEENMPIGSVVVQLNSTDADLDKQFTDVTYQLLDSEHLFSIDAVTGIITTKTAHDREQDSLFSVSVIVKNVADPYGEDTCTVIISIQDVNDFPPVFSEGATTKLHILENSQPGNIHKFVIHDPDEGINAKVDFQIKPLQFSNIFKLDKTTGELWVLVKLDREERSRYDFNVEATNISPPKHGAVQIVTVVVDDVNDNNPEFVKKNYEFTVPEIMILNHTIFEVTATDKDSGSNGLVTYVFPEKSKTAEQFWH